MSALDRTQRRVAAGMAAGLLLAMAALLLSQSLSFGLEFPQQLGIALLLPASTLFVAIARMAKHRFFSPADIDGSALSVATDRARLLQALLQNTAEQLALAVPVYLAALLSEHRGLQAAVVACACCFLLGRVLFFAGYSRGAGARAFGFALTFYPTALLLAWQLARLLPALLR